MPEIERAAFLDPRHAVGGTPGRDHTRAALIIASWGVGRKRDQRPKKVNGGSGGHKRGVKSNRH